jgi:hypothetical protein
MRYLAYYIITALALYSTFLMFLNSSIGSNNLIGNFLALFIANLIIYISIKFWKRMKEKYT